MSEPTGQEQAPPVKWHRDLSWDELPRREGAHGSHYQLYQVGPPGVEGAPVVIRAWFPAGAVVDAHMHACDYTEIILEGSERVGRRWHHAGDVRVAKAGTVYGPIEIGEDGVTKILFFTSDRVTAVPPGGDLADARAV